MSNRPRHPRIIFLNQMAGPLFRELAEDMAQQWPPSLMYTGHPDTLQHGGTAALTILPAAMYQRRSYATRVLSWARYSVSVFFRCLALDKKAVLFMVFPPFVGMIGYLFRKLRGQRYVFLVYDITPDALIRFGGLKENGLIARLWRRVNRLVWENAEMVLTIGDQMAANLERAFDASKTRPGKVLVIPNWANTDWIKPLAKDQNDFARQHGQVDKLTVMYSGNLGQTHDIETILEAARRLRDCDGVRFMIIGEGAKRPLVEQAKSRDGLDNLTVLPYQPEEMLPLSLTTADIAVVTLDKGSEGLMVPSKTYYALAAGSALIGLCDADSEVAHMIQHHQCGHVVSPGDADGMVEAIRHLLADNQQLSRYRANSRQAAERHYSRANTRLYIQAMTEAIPSLDGPACVS